MVTADHIPGIEVTILVDGEPAQEHDDPDEIQIQHEDPQVVAYQAARTISKYIESLDSQPFSIRCKVSEPLGHPKMIYSKLVIEIEVDGIPVWTCFCPRPFFKKNPEGIWEDEVTGVKEGKGRGCTEKELRFAKIETGMFIFPLPFCFISFSPHPLDIFSFFSLK